MILLLKNASNELVIVDSCSNRKNLLLLQKTDLTEEEKNSIKSIIGKFEFNDGKEPEHWLLKIDKREECLLVII